MKTRSPVKRPRPQASEHASNWIEGNYYVTIGLTRRQRSLLARAARQWGFRNDPCATATRLLVMLSLSDLPIVEERWRVHWRRCEELGLRLSRYLDGMAASSLGEPAMRKPGLSATTP
jgi:hypothetical protein